jgi:hypothetical protein
MQTVMNNAITSRLRAGDWVLVPFCRPFCPRAIHPYWREIWLERIPENQLKTD